MAQEEGLISIPQAISKIGIPTEPKGLIKEVQDRLKQELSNHPELLSSNTKWNTVWYKNPEKVIDYARSVYLQYLQERNRLNVQQPQQPIIPTPTDDSVVNTITTNNGSGTLRIGNTTLHTLESVVAITNLPRVQVESSGYIPTFEIKGTLYYTERQIELIRQGQKKISDSQLLKT